MAAYSYGDTTIKESLWNEIQDLDPIELYVTSNAGSTEIGQKFYGWNSDPITNPTNSTGTIEEADTTYAATNPEFITNTTQIIEQGYKVARSNQNADHAGYEDKVAREKAKKMKQWKQVLEIGATVGTLVSGTGTAARTMAGFVRLATITTGHSGVSLTSDMLNDFLATAWTVGGQHDTILVGATLKSRISSFTVGNTRNVEAGDGTVVGRIDVYDSDFGRMDVILHRHINKAAANTYNVLATYIQDFVKVGFMDEPHDEPRAITGYFDAGAIVGEAGVKLGNRLAAQLVRGLL